MQKVVLIVGPTAIGKTSLAIDLAKKLNTEIISGDSMQVYKELSIGTAKATADEQKQIKHHLIDQRSIFDEYSVKDFVHDAQAAIDELTQVGKLPMVVGGTGFYLNALVNKMQLGEVGEYDSGISQQWLDFYDKYGEERLWQRLYEQDPVAAKAIPQNNVRRVLRALTVIERTGEKFSQQQTEIEPRYDALFIGLNTDREVVYQRINQRVDLMMKVGLLDEAKFVFDHRMDIHQARQAIGYKEFFPYFEHRADLDTCVVKLKQASRKYAKRQLTYFRNKLNVEWFDPLHDDHVEEKILQRIKQWQNKQFLFE